MNTPEHKIEKLKEALQLISKPTTKRVRLAAEIVMRIIQMEKQDGFCEPAHFEVFRYKPEVTGVMLKKFICAICPNCGSKTFDLNTEIMQGSCLSCTYKSFDYKGDMQKRHDRTANEFRLNHQS